MINEMTGQVSISTVAFLVSAGPIIIAQIMANLTDKSKRSIFYPFHKDGWRNISSHLMISTVACVVPVFIFVHMILSEPGLSTYYALWN